MSNPAVECIDRSRFKGEKDTLALFCWEGEKIDTQSWLDSRREQSIADIAKRENFKGKAGDLLVYPTEQGPAARLLFIGLGKKKEAKLEALREASGRAAKATLKQSETLWVDIPSWPEKIPLTTLAKTITEGLLLGQYRFLKYKNSDDDSRNNYILKKFSLVVEKPDEVSTAHIGIERGKIFAESTNFVRDLVNEPPSNKHPEDLAKVAKKLISRQVKARVYAKSELETMGMNGILGEGK